MQRPTIPTCKRVRGRMLLQMWEEGDVQSAYKLLAKEEKKEVETVDAGTKAQNSTVASCDVGDSGAFLMQDG
ncbi:hypothetical protein M758_UG304100 [Ceratodon purpureus]|nr:hypothetical protein M758_UG304100 [Ceratodon purpureus]